eukprot:1162062-Pelagomonas_calceolata.AAC.3
MRLGCEGNATKAMVCFYVVGASAMSSRCAWPSCGIRSGASHELTCMAILWHEVWHVVKVG